MAGLSLVVLFMSAVTIAVMTAQHGSSPPDTPINWTLANSCFLLLALLCTAILFSHARDPGLHAWERIVGRSIAAVPVLLLVVALMHDLLLI